MLVCVCMFMFPGPKKITSEAPRGTGGLVKQKARSWYSFIPAFPAVVLRRTLFGFKPADHPPPTPIDTRQGAHAGRLPLIRH